MKVSQAGITGVLLAGGLGRRMGGIDKGLAPLDGRPMAAHAIERLAPQVDELLINANQNAHVWAGFGLRVIADDVAGFAGPLAGLHAALTRAAHERVVTVPCDSPFLPHDLVARLAAAWHDAGADVAVARTFEQLHPVFCLCRRDLAGHIETYLASGGRRIENWLASLKTVEVAFDDEADAFRNINTLQELDAARQRPQASG